MKFTNQVTELLKITYPILSAPMAGVSGGGLAKAVSTAGGLGFIGVGYNDTTWLQQQFDLAKDTHVGVGFITWQLAKRPELLTLALTYNPIAIMLSFGDSTEFAAKIKSTQAKLICQVQNVEDAKIAAQCGADIIVAQGSEAGGHGANRSTFTLVPAIVDVVGTIPVIAAGGVSDGRGLAAALMLGAQGVLIGTRFYASTEALGSIKAKQLIVETDGDHTMRGNLFDLVRGLNWPAPFTIRSLQNKFSDKWQQSDFKEIDATMRAEYQKAYENEDYSIAGVFAGETVDLIHDILPAKEIVQKIIQETKSTLLKKL